MHLSFRKISHGPAWERLQIIEEQRGDAGYAGEAILTYSETGTYADVVCDILFTRELTETDIDDLLNAACSILSGQGKLTVYTTREVICKNFSLLSKEEKNQHQNRPGSSEERRRD